VGAAVGAGAGRVSRLPLAALLVLVGSIGVPRRSGLLDVP